VLLQFLVESVVISSLGGLIGIVLALLTSTLLAGVFCKSPSSSMRQLCSSALRFRRRWVWCLAMCRLEKQPGWTRLRRCGMSRELLSLPMNRIANFPIGLLEIPVR
jgi:ABC-type antimicrobial peptide transport system permease subunit